MKQTWSEVSILSLDYNFIQESSYFSLIMNAIDGVYLRRG
jgi:hypothetical protein